MRISILVAGDHERWRIAALCTGFDQFVYALSLVDQAVHEQIFAVPEAEALFSQSRVDRFHVRERVGKIIDPGALAFSFLRSHRLMCIPFQQSRIDRKQGFHPGRFHGSHE